MSKELYVSARKEGHLHKLSRLMSQWKEEYYLLENDVLKSFRHQADTVNHQIHKQISIKGARILCLDVDDYGRENVFGIIPLLSTRTFVFAAQSEQDRDDWIKALSSGGGTHSSSSTSTITAQVQAQLSPKSQHTRTLSSDSKVDPRSIKEGFLIKQGAKVKNWRRRYFVLYSHTLHYYKHKGDVVPAGEIHLGGGVSVEQVTLKDAEKPFVFSITSIHLSSARKYLILADSQEIREEWMNAIRRLSSLPLSTSKTEVIIEEQADAKSTLDSDDETDNTPVNTANQIASQDEIVNVKQGWLSKLGGFIKNWKLRYFVLESSPSRRVIKYYKTACDERDVGEIVITNGAQAQPDHSQGAQRPFALTVQPVGCARQYVLVAESEESRQAWLQAIAVAAQGHASCVKFVNEQNETYESSMSETKASPGIDMRMLSLNRSRSDENHYIDPNCQLEGWLIKITSNLKHLSTKFLILTSHQLIYFHHKPTRETLSQHKAIPLRGAIIKEEQKEKIIANLKGDFSSSFFFSVKPSTINRSFIFACDSESQLRQWVDAIQTQITHFESVIVNPTSLKEGFLARFHTKSHSWKRGYYVLPNNKSFLLEFQDQLHATKHDSASAKLNIIDTNIQLVPNDRYNRPCTFCIQSSSGQQNDETRWICSADTREDMEDWVDVLMFAQEQEETQVRTEQQQFDDDDDDDEEDDDYEERVMARADISRVVSSNNNNSSNSNNNNNNNNRNNNNNSSNSNNNTVVSSRNTSNKDAVTRNRQDSDFGEY